ncbi:MAG: SNF2 helicase associated domain-containing protein, partial [Clostridium sp.]
MDNEEIKERLKQYENRRNMHKGKRIFNNGYVTKMETKEYESEALSIKAIVLSETNDNEYNAEFTIDLEDGEILDTECDCQDFYSNNNWNETYICKHVAALYFQYIESLDSNHQKRNENYLNRISEYFLGGIENLQSIKEKVNLEVSLDVIKTYNNEYFEANFKVGTKKMYVVKSLRDLIVSINKNTPLNYGKAFTFDPNIHEFKDEDTKIIQFIEDYIVTKDLYVSDTSGYYSNKVKSLKISSTSIRRFLELIACKKNCGLKVHLNIIEGDIPLELKMGVEEDKISLQIVGEKVSALSRKFDVFSYEDNIYLPSEVQCKNLKILLSCTQKDDKILFKKDDANRIFNSIVPMLENTSKNIEFEESLKEFEREDLEPSFYFDENRKEITLEVKLKYGENTLSLIESENEGKIIIRDTNKEHEIVKAVENLNISLHGKKFSFNG